MSTIKQPLRSLEVLLCFLRTRLLQAIKAGLRSLEVLLCFLRNCLLQAVKASLSRLEVLLRRLQLLLSSNTFVVEHNLLSPVKDGLRRLECLLCSLHDFLRQAVKTCLRALKCLLRRLQFLLSGDALVGQRDLLSSIETSLCFLKFFLRGLKRFLSSDLIVRNLALLNPIKRSLCGIVLLLRGAELLLSSNALVSEDNLLSAVKFGLCRLECLLCSLERELLTTIQSRLSSLECAIDDALASLEILPSLLQRCRGRDVLVGQHDLLSAVFLSLRSLEGLRFASQRDGLLSIKSSLLGLERLASKLKRLCSVDLLVCQHELSGAILFSLRGLKGLRLASEGHGLGAIKSCLLRLERLSSKLKRLRGVNLLVSQHNLGGTILLSLRGLERLGRNLKSSLLAAIQIVLSCSERQLLLLHGRLICPL